MIDRVTARARAPAGTKCRSASSGSSTACSTARSALPGKRAPARRFCGATDRCGPRTKTASSRLCWRRRCWPSRGRDPGELYRDLTQEFGEPVYERIDAPATPEQKDVLQHLAPQQIEAPSWRARRSWRCSPSPGQRRAIGGVKVITANGWFAARPSGTEDVYKIYAESFRNADHLRRSRTRLKP